MNSADFPGYVVLDDVQPDDLHRQYIEALIDRLRAYPVERDSSPICDRIERNLAEWYARAAASVSLDGHLTESAPIDAPLDSHGDASETAPTSIAAYLDEPFGAEADEPHEAVPDAPRGVEREASGATPEPAVPLDGGSVKPAADPSGNPGHIVTPDSGKSATPVLVPLTVERLAAGGHASRPVVLRPSLDCNPGCGRTAFGSNAGLSGHRRFCAEWQAYREAHVREVAPLPGALGPVPTAEDPLEARQAFEARRHELARKAADDAWRRRHGGEAVR